MADGPQDPPDRGTPKAGAVLEALFGDRPGAAAVRVGPPLPGERSQQAPSGSPPGVVAPPSTAATEAGTAAGDGAAPAASSSAFDAAFALTVGEEGGFSQDPRDGGNWTGGAPGKGSLRGTKYGISAASYPALDIGALTLAGAKAIYRRDFWDAVRGDVLPRSLAVALFDAAVNSGARTAVRWLQAELGVAADGVVGERTMAALVRQHGRGLAVLVGLQARRLAYDEALGTWAIYGRGWQARILTVLAHAVALEAGGTG